MPRQVWYNSVMIDKSKSHPKWNVGDITQAGTIVAIQDTKATNTKGRRFRIACADCGTERWSYHMLKRCKVCYTNRQRQDPTQRSTYKYLRTSVKGGATKRQLEWNLTIDEFINIVKQDCYWCGEEAPIKAPPRSYCAPAPANTIDRVDNDKGYTTDNSVASCVFCNVAKNDNTQADFLAAVSRIYNYQRSDK